MTRNLSRNTVWLSAVSVSIFLFFALTFVTLSGYSYGAALLFLISLAYVATRPSWNLSDEDKTIAFILLAVFAISLAIFIIHGDEPKTLDQTSRCLMAIPILLLLLKIPPRLTALWAGLAIGAISAAAVALWQYHYLGVTRPSGFMTSAIPFGDIGLMAGVLCLAGMPWAAAQARFTRGWQLILAIGFLSGLYTSFISASRGGWLAIPAVLVLFCIAFLRRKNLRRTAISAILLLAAIGATASLLQNDIEGRYDEAVTEVSQYAQHRKADTSIGMRLEAWRAAGMNIAERPILGWSYKDYENRLDVLAAEKITKSSVLELANTHNNYIEVWLHQGLFGLLALLALYVAPFWFFCKRLRSKNATVQALALGGTSLLASFFIFGLTQVILGRNNGILFFLVALVAFWGAMRCEEQKVDAAG